MKLGQYLTYLSLIAGDFPSLSSELFFRQPLHYKLLKKLFLITSAYSYLIRLDKNIIRIDVTPETISHIRKKYE
ncbi:unknown [Bacteroides sp. CAG:754]|jgi:hypothetical protein|nr:unknown [Bacteroides sp. CAG:754]